MAKVTTREFIETGPGTLAGRYLRSFWQPVYRAEDLAAGRAVPIKVMGEEFTLYRGEKGETHLVDSRCAHRGTQLSTGWVDGDGIRCRYHGWKYDGEGRCVEQPGEDSEISEFKGSKVQGLGVKIASYPVKEYLGLVFAYLGEGEPPPFRRFPDFERDFVLEVGLPEIWPCNYWNRMDNQGDGQHVPWAHRDTILRVGREDQLVDRSVESEETDYGMRTCMRAPGKPDAFLHFHMPNINQTRSRVRVEGSVQDAAGMWSDRLFFLLPVDDASCVMFTVDMIHLTGAVADAYRDRRKQAERVDMLEVARVAEEILAGRMDLRDVDPSWSSYKTFMIEDYLTQVGQGKVADRAPGIEHLGRIDKGVVFLRLLWLRELSLLADGKPLKRWHTPAGLADMSLAPPLKPAMAS